VAEAADADGRSWEWEGGYPQRITRTGDVVIVADCFESPDAPSRFAEFIAIFDPPTVLALLTELARLSRNGDPDYSPDYQDEYQRLWHEARAEVAHLEQGLRQIAEYGGALPDSRIQEIARSLLDGNQEASER
jgi:hypothetical protein